MDPTAINLMARLRQSPLDLNALEAVRAHCDDRADFATWGEALELHARALTEAEGDPAEIGELHFRLGNLWRDELRRVDRALAHYRAAIDFDAAQRSAMSAARAIYAEAGRWDQVAKLLSREAESLPEGQKRVALLAELAGVYSERLDDRVTALEILREATDLAPNDLHIRHQLATLLLDLADREPHRGRASMQRSEAADVLCTMAQAVADDYALAYLEAALDAVPNHARSLSLIEIVAPRLGREDVPPARWVSAIQAAPEASETRDVRLKLARAYVRAGQIGDAKACLAILLDANDLDAHDILGTTPASASNDPDEEVTLLDPALISGAEPQPDIEEIAAPLTDLALLARADVTVVERPNIGETESTLTTSLDALSYDADSVEVALAEADPELRAREPEEDLEEFEPEAHDFEPDEDELEPDEDELSGQDDELEETELAPEEELFEDDVDSEDESDAFPSEVTPARPASLSDAPKVAAGPLVSEDTRVAAVKAIEAALEALPEELEEIGDREIGGEVTQPRAIVEIPAEARAETSAERATLERTPYSGIKMPVSQRPAATVAPKTEPQEDELTRLRAELERRLRFRDRRGAAEVANSILTHAPTDGEAIQAIQEQLRATRNFPMLRDFFAKLGDDGHFTDADRIGYLRDAADLSENTLGDPQGAWNAWRALLTLLPSDEHAFAKLRHAYTRGELWDLLCSLLQARVEQLEGAAERAKMQREIGEIERDKRQNLDLAIDAYRKAQELDAVAEDDETIANLLFAAGRLSEGAQVLEARLARTDDETARLALLSPLSELYETKLNDLERAYETSEMLLALRPDDAAALDRLERIDTRCQRFDRLLATLETRLPLTPAEKQPEAWLRIAEVALEHLHDIPKAIEAAQSGFAQDPENRTNWPRVAALYADAQQERAFTELLWETAENPAYQSVHYDLALEVASRRLKERDRGAAIAAYELALTLRTDQAVLAAVVNLLRDEERHAELCERLDQLAQGSDRETAKVLRLERAELFAEKLDNTEAAKAELEGILADLAPKDSAILQKLIGLADKTQDATRALRAREQLLPLLGSADARAELASLLVETYENERQDSEAALRVLNTWARLDAAAPSPYLRSIPLLSKLERKKELLAAYDKLSQLAMADDEVSEFVRRAAQVAVDLADYDGAWARLLPRVTDANDVAAEAQLRELAELAGRGAPLAELYVGLAQRTGDAAVEKSRWVDASAVYETMLGDCEKAFEATLRAFAKDLDDPGLLDEAERLTQLANAWPRLSKVYDALIRRAESVSARVGLLMRHAALLERHAGDFGAAFERASLAFQLETSATETYSEAKRLAGLAAQGEALLSLHERRAAASISTPEKLDALLEASATAQRVLEEPPKAMGYLVRAVTLAQQDESLLDRIEAHASTLDMEEIPLDGRGLTHTVAEAYRARIEETRREEGLVRILALRAARIFDGSLDDLDSAHKTLARAAALVPSNEEVLDVLEQTASRANKLPELAKLFQQLADDAIDSATASTLLRRLAALLEGNLAAPAEAAEVYKQLVMLRPRDVAASEGLRACLSAAGQHQELLTAIERHLQLVDSDEERIRLLRETALAWEYGLKNRFEASDAWRRVLKHAPEDAEALTAIERLKNRPVIDDETLLEGNVVVLPEDLHPSAPPPPMPALEAPSLEAFGSEPVTDAAVTATSTVDTDAAVLAQAALETEAGETYDAEAAEPTEVNGRLPEASAFVELSESAPEQNEDARSTASVADPKSFETETPESELISATAQLAAQLAAEEALDAVESGAADAALAMESHKPPAPPWEDATAPLRATGTAPSAMLMELASLDAQAEENASDLWVSETSPGTSPRVTLAAEPEELEELTAESLDGLSSLMDLSASRPPARLPTRAPAPPASVSGSAPPPPPSAARAVSVPPPVPGARNVGAPSSLGARGPSIPPPPPGARPSVGARGPSVPPPPVARNVSAAPSSIGARGPSVPPPPPRRG